MSKHSDILLKQRSKILLILFFLISFQMIAGITIYYIYNFVPALLSKEAFNTILKVILYGNVSIIFFFMFQFFKVNHTLKNDKNFRIQFNDERIRTVRLKSMASGFLACMITFCFFIVLLSLEIIVFKSTTIAEISGLFIALVICSVSLATAVVSYFTSEK